MNSADWLEVGRNYYLNFTEKDLEGIMTVIQFVLRKYVKGENISAYNIEYRMKQEGFQVTSSDCMKAFSLLSHMQLIKYSYEKKHSYLQHTA